MNGDRIAELLAAGAPIDMWGVGTDLVTSRAAPVVNGVYKLVAVERGGRRVPVRKLSQGKVTYPDAKQIYRRRRRPEWYPVELSPRLQAESAALRKAGDEG